MNKALPLLAILACAVAASARASDDGSEVVVVYNSRMPESKSVAQYYEEKRGVPYSQVIGLDLSTNLDISRTEFQETLQRPLAKLLESKRLWHVARRPVPGGPNQPTRMLPGVVQSKIRYAVLCYGVPVRIEEVPELKEAGTEKLRSEMQRNQAAVDSELAFLPLLEQDLPLAGPLRNPVYSSTNAALMHPTNNVLMVTRLDGPSAAIARGLVDKALTAERDGLWGRTYFDLRNIADPGYKLGDDWIRSASQICWRLGYETIVDTNADTFPAGFPMSQIAVYIGWYAGSACGPFAQPTVEFMPGAFAYHLFSFSGADLRSPDRFWVGPLLAKGATITMGCVYEPYLSGTPDVAVFTARLLYNGFTFGEAAYASQSVLSWMTTVVGDPLYRPCGKKPEQFQKELEARGSDLVPWTYLRLMDLNLANGRTIREMMPLFEQVEAAHPSAVLAEKLGDLYAAQGKPASAVSLYERALKLGPSPQQRLRLRLTLGEKLPGLSAEETGQNGEAEAYEDYQAILREDPDYPDKLVIYQKLLPLARKLNRTAEAEHYESQIKLLTVANK